MATIRRRCGSWQVQIRRAGEQPRSKSFSTRAEAQRWAWDAEAGVSPTITVDEILRRYGDLITSAKKGADREQFKLTVLRRSLLACVDARLITTAHLAEYRDNRLRVAQSGTVRRELAVLRHSLGIARREWGFTDIPDPFAQFRMPKPARARNRRLTDGEALRLSEAVEKSRAWYLAPVVALAIATAMRRGELLSMRWSWTDLGRRIVVLPDTKNGEPRTVPLSPSAISVFNNVNRVGDRLFPIREGTFAQAWKAAVRRARLHDLRFHDLRHEAISRFFEQGLSVPEVALISGHKDVRMLFRYTHLRAEDVARKLAIDKPL